MGNNLEHFGTRPEIYLISLPKDIQRRSALNIKPDYTYAVDGSQILTNDTDLTKGELGCYLSHVHMLSKALNSPSKYVLVLEDDVGHIPLESLDTWIRDAPVDFELLFLGWNYYEKFDYEQISYLHGTQSYVINTHNVTQEKINKLFPAEKPIDITLPTKFISYVIKPKTIELGPYASYSNTQNVN